jgi:hypothetical protein
MTSALWSRLIRLRVTLGYGLLLVAVTRFLERMPADAHQRAVEHASTNLDNLGHGRVGTLVVSAFVVDAGPILAWLPGLMCLLGVAELLWRSARLVLAFVLGHVGATVLVAVGLAAAVRFGWLPGTVTAAIDVGMSYGAVSVLGALTPAIPKPWRPVWIGWWLALGTAALAAGADFANAGHLLALTLGMAVATRFGRPQHWTPVTIALLAVGATFGYLILINGVGPLLSVTLAGSAGAVLGAVVTLLVGIMRSGPPKNGCTDLDAE